MEKTTVIVACKIIDNAQFCQNLKVHKIENFFDSDFGICVISLLVMSKYQDFTKKKFELAIIGGGTICELGQKIFFSFINYGP